MDGDEREALRLTAKKSAVAVAAGLAVLLAAALFWYASQIILLLFAGVLFSIALRGIAQILVRHTPAGPRLSLAITLLLMAGLLTAAVLLIAPRFGAQFEELSEQVPRSLARLEQSVREIEWLPDQFKPNNVPDEVGKEVSPRRILGFFATIAGALTGMMVILFVGIYLAADAATYQEGILRLFPPQRRDRAAEIFLHIDSTLQWWLLGRAIEMVFIGVLTWVGLQIIGFPLALSLAIIAGLLNFIPYIGPVISAIPALLVALALGPRSVLSVLIIYVVVQSLESYVLTPIVDRKTVWLPPALTVGAQVLFAFLFGAIGVLLATPLTAVMVVLTKKLYLEGVYGEKVELSRADASGD